MNTCTHRVWMCPKCLRQEVTPLPVSAVEHTCTKANDYDKRMYGGLVALKPVVADRARKVKVAAR